MRLVRMTRLVQKRCLTPTIKTNVTCQLELPTVCTLKMGKSVQDNISVTALNFTALERRPGISIEKVKMELAIVGLMAMIPNAQKKNPNPT